MQIIKDKQYETIKENSVFKFISYNSNGTLSIVMDDGTHYNFRGEELRIIVNFIKEKIK